MPAIRTFFSYCLSTCFVFFNRHMKEISELQAFQRNEIEHLYKELGKTLPPNVGLLHAAPPSGRRRRASKHKLKAGKLLNPMVQQLKNNLNTSTERKGMTGTDFSDDDVYRGVFSLCGSFSRFTKTQECVIR